jgi:hypothetical protein
VELDAGEPMVDQNDWRIASGQEQWCRGLVFRWSRWAPTPTIAYKPDGTTEPATWDHDHCEFCWREFCDTEHVPSALWCRLGRRCAGSRRERRAGGGGVAEAMLETALARTA